MKTNVKSIALLLLLFAVTCLLSGCGCEHEWSAATCLEPETCIKCGETQGETLEHEWSAATCLEPETCIHCGETRGEPLGHEWEAETCTTPRTCIRCGEQQGEPLGHDWNAATCFEPETCSRCGEQQGEPLGHDWNAATCFEPEACSRCGEQRGEPLGHVWKAATCMEPETCARCGETTGGTGDHIWQAGTDTTPSMCIICGEMKPMLEPFNGEVVFGSSPDPFSCSELTINNSSDTATYVKLKDQFEMDIYGFYVRAGQSANVNVPSGFYYVYFASGTTWYGPEYCFGEDTYYSKDPEILDFETYTWEYTLYPVENGNFSETPIGGDEF